MGRVAFSSTVLDGILAAIQRTHPHLCEESLYYVHATNAMSRNGWDRFHLVDELEERAAGRGQEHRDCRREVESGERENCDCLRFRRVEGVILDAFELCDHPQPQWCHIVPQLGYPEALTHWIVGSAWHIDETNHDAQMLELADALGCRDDVLKLWRLCNVPF